MVPGCMHVPVLVCAHDGEKLEVTINQAVPYFNDWLTVLGHMSGTPSFSYLSGYLQMWYPPWLNLSHATKRKEACLLSSSPLPLHDCGSQTAFEIVPL